MIFLLTFYNIPVIPSIFLFKVSFEIIFLSWDFPEGSPIYPVAPPIKKIGLNPNIPNLIIEII